jgi:hypothetical protein
MGTARAFASHSGNSSDWKITYDSDLGLSDFQGLSFAEASESARVIYRNRVFFFSD